MVEQGRAPDESVQRGVAVVPVRSYTARASRVSAWVVASVAILLATASCGGGGGGDDDDESANSGGQVAAAPVVLTQPTDSSVDSGASATFVSAASGSPAPTVQWQMSSDGGVTFVTIVGAIAATYVAPDTVLGDNGNRFRAVFTNPSGTATSAAAQLSIRASTRLLPLAGNIGGPGNIDGTGPAARLSSPYGIAIDASGNLFVAETFNHVVRKITPGGVVSVYAGRPGEPDLINGPRATARFAQPKGLAIDAAGNLFVADSENNTIRKITPAGMVSSVAGNPLVSGVRLRARIT